MNFASQTKKFCQWLVDAPRVDDGGISFTKSLVEEFKRCGLDVWRISFTLNTMHPEVLWRTLQWQDEIGVRVVDRPHDQKVQSIYVKSPIPIVRAGGAPIYVHFDDEPLPFPICEDLKKEGGRAYFAIGLPNSFGEYGYISMATKNPLGFDEETRFAIEEIKSQIARHIELEAAYHLTNSLLSVYLGKTAAKRVIAGNFKRGQGELIKAAIWFCDLRGFTELAARTDPDALVQKLDTYLEIVTDSITEHGGDVLKYIGDAVLAIFPLEADAGKSCQNALKAAQESLSKLDKHPDLKIGIALHVGEVLYGNIGGRDRLDFTVISSAVNEASRLESMCKDLNSPLVFSEIFVEAADLKNTVDLGSHKLKGVKNSMKIFSLTN